MLIRVDIFVKFVQSVLKPRVLCAGSDSENWEFENTPKKANKITINLSKYMEAKIYGT